MEQKTCFQVSFTDPKEKKTVTLHVKEISDSNLGLSFVRLSGFIFNTTEIIVDPEEEHLRKKFENVKSLHISIYSILSITEIGLENKGLHFKANKSNLLVLNNENRSEH